MTCTARIAVLLAPFALAACAGTQALQGTRAPDIYSRIEEGMTQQQVRERLGPPDRTMAFPRNRTVAWDYDYTDPWGYMAELAVTFDESGRVRSRISLRRNDGGDHN